MGVLITLWNKLGSPRWFYNMSRSWTMVFGVLAIILLAAGTIWGLAYSPADYQQGNSFRIMYIHVPTAIVAQSSYLMMGVAGVVLLVWRMKLADVLASAIVPLGFSLTLIALFTGAIWGKPTWGTWWVWDARTTSMLVLLFLFIGVGALRDAITSMETAGRACAILAVVGMINIPIIKYSVDWWLTLHQSSSFSLVEAPSMPPSMWIPLLLNVLGMYCFFGAVLTSLVRTGILKREENTAWVRDIVEHELA